MASITTTPDASTLTADAVNSAAEEIVRNNEQNTALTDALERIQQQLGLMTGVDLKKTERLD